MSIIFTSVIVFVVLLLLVLVGKVSAGSTRNHSVPPPYAPPVQHPRRPVPQNRQVPPQPAPLQPRLKAEGQQEEQYDSYADVFEDYYYAAQARGIELNPWELPPEKYPWEKR